jgi:hypothetical protein
LVEETGVPCCKLPVYPDKITDKLYHIMLYQVHLVWNIVESGFKHQISFLKTSQHQEKKQKSETDGNIDSNWEPALKIGLG